ncbi:MAG: PorV/PorQ family protein [Flavobacteriaceae bacterium]|nr:PorV/PorQ family protein [Flavobacteriaceae bacterium]MDG2314926.1 PorV/PorQ family protein [Flavobacteriaceae bacterium]
MLRIFFIIGFVGILYQSTHAQAVRKYSNEFLNIGVDARAFGMANAVVASTNDVSATYWNPAGLMNLKDTQLSLMHASYFANIAQYDVIGMARPIDNRSAAGITLLRFGVDNILNTTQLIDNQGNIDYNRITKFSAADYALIVSYARKSLTKNYTYGVNAKIIRRVIGDFASSWGFGFDVGIQFSNNSWSFGLTARDITTTFNLWQIDTEMFDAVSQELPEQEAPETSEITLPKIQLGIARLFELNRRYYLHTELDLNMRFTKTNDIISSKPISISPALGLELQYDDFIFLRTGIGNFQNELQFDNTNSVTFQPNIGVGIIYKGIEIDYALTDIGNQSTVLYSNIFSIKINWKQFR